MHHNGKRLEIMNLHRIPTAGLKENGICSSLTQHQISDGKAKNATEYRKEIFKEIKAHIQQNNNINNITITGDYNQDI